MYVKLYAILWVAEVCAQRFEFVVLWTPGGEGWEPRGTSVGHTIVWYFQVSQKKVKQEVAC